MKCPKCQNPNLAYTVKLQRVKTRDAKKGEIRTDFNAVCSRCGWKGEIGKPKIDVVEEMDKIERRELLEEGRKSE